jgi:hypothetical protein
MSDSVEVMCTSVHRASRHTCSNYFGELCRLLVIKDLRASGAAEAGSIGSGNRKERHG